MALTKKLKRARSLVKFHMAQKPILRELVGVEAQKKRLETARQTLADTAAQPQTNAVEAPLMWEVLVGEITRLVDGVFTLVEGQSPVPGLCVLAGKEHSLSSGLATYCANNRLALSYRKGNAYVPIQGMRTLESRLRSRPVLRLRLDDLASGRHTLIQLQVWREESGYVLAPCNNRIAKKITRKFFDAHLQAQPGRTASVADVLNRIPEDLVSFEVDYVYTWVDSQDPEWRKLYSKYKPDFDSDASSMSRFQNREELKHSLRSIECFAPWVRNVYVVSNCAAPGWWNHANPRAHWIRHEEIFESKDLPTFSSHAIESRLHRIPGLSNYWIYSNDDFFLARPTRLNDFFEPNGLCKIKLESWGSVNGELSESDPDYLNAARNGQRLLEEEFGVSPTQLSRHAPHAMRTDIMTELEARFPKEFAQTASNRFRAISDISVTSFLFLHYAYITGRALKDNASTRLIQVNHPYHKRFNELLAGKTDLSLSAPLSFCINDGAGSHLNDDWNESAERFLREYLPIKSAFEK